MYVPGYIPANFFCLGIAFACHGTEINRAFSPIRYLQGNLYCILYI